MAIDIDKLRPEIEADAEWLVIQFNGGYCLETDDEVNRWTPGWFDAVFSCIGQKEDGSYFLLHKSPSGGIDAR